MWRIKVRPGGLIVGATSLLAIDWKRLATVFVPALLIAAISIYVLGYRAPANPDPKVLPGHGSPGRRY